jgi:mannitol-1-phosphate 5-dehydrogenase
VEIFNPRVAEDRDALVRAVSEAGEIATALPSVEFYGAGQAGDVAHVLGAGLRAKAGSPALPRAVIYAAENHNRAAEILEAALRAQLDEATPAKALFLNTVIGKMSGVVTDPEQIREQGLACLAPGADRAFLVEAFNRILVTHVAWPDFRRGIAVFEEKDDLLPFEEAKLYGHNATHALLGYLLQRRGATFMSEAAQDPALVRLAREAFTEESGAALCRRHAGIDPLFTAEGYRGYADDLIARMLNPHLRDRVARVCRDPRRKLGWDDRLVGTMRVALREGIAPTRYAAGAAAALDILGAETGVTPAAALDELWHDVPASQTEKDEIRRLIRRPLPA